MTLGAAAREEQARLLEQLEKGSHIRDNYVQEAARKRSEDKKRIGEIRVEIADIEGEKNTKEAIKRDAESREKAAVDKYKAIQDEERRQREEADIAHQAEIDKIQAEAAFRVLDLNGNGFVSFDELQTNYKFDKNRDGNVDADEAKVGR